MRMDHAGPTNPRWILLFALAAPGLGHFALGRFGRALGFAFFTLLLAVLTYKVSAVDRSIIGRTAGGLFVWALSIPDAYKTACLRYRAWSLVGQG